MWMYDDIHAIMSLLCHQYIQFTVLLGSTSCKHSPRSGRRRGPLRPTAAGTSIRASSASHPSRGTYRPSPRWSSTTKSKSWKCLTLRPSSTVIAVTVLVVFYVISATAKDGYTSIKSNIIYYREISNCYCIHFLPILSVQIYMNSVYQSYIYLMYDIYLR